MVGVVIFKDFETGSYENMTVTCFAGNSFEDIERSGEFVSYLVSAGTIKVRFVAGTEAASFCPSYSEIYRICSEAKRFLCENSYCTVAEFAGSETEISFRFRSGKCGVYAPVDMRNLRNPKADDIYALCGEVKGKEPLYLSLICDVLNFAVQTLFDAEEEIYGFSGTGIYINTSVFLQKFNLSKKIPKNRNRYRRHRVDIRKTKKVSFAVETESAPSTTGAKVINGYRCLKRNVLELVSDIFTVSDLLDLPKSEKLHSLAEVFYEELKDVLRVYTFAFEARSHIYYIGIKDALSLVTCGESMAEPLVKPAGVLSANMKLREKLPNPDYYTSSGKGLWKD